MHSSFFSIAQAGAHPSPGVSIRLPCLASAQEGQVSPKFATQVIFWGSLYSSGSGHLSQQKKTSNCIENMASWFKSGEWKFAAILQVLKKHIDNPLKGPEPTGYVCAPTTPADLAKFTFLNNGKGILKSQVRQAAKVFWDMDKLWHVRNWRDRWNQTSTGLLQTSAFSGWVRDFLQTPHESPKGANTLCVLWPSLPKTNW